MSLPRSKRKKLMIFIIAGVLAAAAVIWYLISSYNVVSTDDAYIEGRIHTIAPKIPGTVKVVNVDDNQKLKNGDLLIEIDPADYELRVSEAQAALDMRRVSFDQAVRDKERTETLYEKKVLSKDNYKHILTAYNVAKAQVHAAETQLKIASLNLEYTKIYAPSDGYVTKKSVEIGNQVQPGQALMAVVSDDMWIVANYKETQLKRVQPGQEVKIKVDTYPGKIFEGHVDSIQRGTGAQFRMFPPENAAGNFVKVVQRIPVKIVFDGRPNEKYNFSIGMSTITEIKVR
jgi:membrane fusion protein (multidrug efflux system)